MTNFSCHQIDNNLNKISSNNLGGNRNDSGNFVIADSDGGYVAIGSTMSTEGDVTAIKAATTSGSQSLSSD